MIVARLRAIRSLKRERAAAVNRLVSGSASGRQEEIQAALEAIERTGKALDAVAAPRWGVTAAVGVVSAAVATALLWTPVTTFISLPITLTLDSRLVRFETDEEWSLRERMALGAGKLDIRGVSELQERGLGLRDVDAARTLALESEIARGSLAALGVAAKSRVLLERTSGALFLYGFTGSIDAQLQIPSDAALSLVSGATARQVDAAPESMKNSPPHVVTVAARDIRGFPMMLRMPLSKVESIAPWRFQVADYLDFTADPTTTGNYAESAIRTGEVRFPSIEVKHALNAGDSVALANPRGRLFVDYTDDSLSLMFEGDVFGVETASGRVRTSIAPSTLEYLYLRKPLEVLWTAILFIGGLLWSVGRFLSS